MPIQCTVVRSLGEFVDSVTPVRPDPASGRLRDTGVYRGCAEVDAPLLTALDRLGGIDSPHSKANVEAHILRNFIRHSRPHLHSHTAGDWEVLIAAQHHGVPTRLLDWSYSPLVAAHFATIAPGASDRVVWRLEWRPLHRQFGFPELALLIEDLNTLAGQEKPFTPWRLFDADDVPPFACLIDPPALDVRIMAQSAAFTLCSRKDTSLDAFLAEVGLEDALSRFVIRAADVQRIRDQLDLVGVSERHLFPDLDGVAEEIHRYYS